MNNSLFKKYYTSFAIMLLVCIFVLGIALMFFSAQYFKSDREELLTRAASNAADITADNYRKNGFLVRSDLESSYSLIAETAGGKIFYCGLDGSVKICSDLGGCSHIGLQAPAKGISSILTNGSFYSVAYNSPLSLDGSYSIIAGLPVVSSGTICGYIFVAAPILSLISFMTDVFLVIQITSFIMLLVVAGVMYSLLKRMLQPLSEISAAATAFGNGDFTARVRVRGDDEIGSLGRVFNKMADDLQELEISRRSFMGNVAHELRTPMTTIGGYIDGILDGTIPASQQSKYLKIVSDEVKRLARLTSSTLAVARMEETSDSTALSDINVCQILTTVALSAERRISAKHISVDGLDNPDTYARGDADMLHQILYNLVDNAIKFTPDNGAISFLVKSSAKRVYISVKNTGAGISKTDMPLIFDRFYKTDKSRGTDKTGSGLGLYIVKTLVTKMGGDITVSSTEGKSCTFTVDLEAGAPPVKKAAEDHPVQKNTLLERINKLGKRREKDE